MKRSKKEERRFKGCLPPDTLVEVKCRNGQWLLARIVDTQALSHYSETPNAYKYYIHFEGLNRRLDQWVSYDSIREHSSIENNTLCENDNYIQHDEYEGLDQKQISMHQENTKVRRINYLEIGGRRCQTWYFSPFPEDFQDIETLFACEFCLNPYKSKEEVSRHRCRIRFPPGNEIYRDGNTSVFEVDGAKAPIYCENVAFLAKLFLDHKTLEYDVSPFLFYMLTEREGSEWRIVGYFSKEKESDQGYNLACILIFPFVQRSGYGKFLISLSYELSRLEGKKGTPERPLSDLGFRVYLKWWAERLLVALQKRHTQLISIAELSDLTYIKEEDVVVTLESLKILRYDLAGNGRIYANQGYLEAVEKTLGPKGRKFKAEKLHWTPYRG